MYWPKEGTEVFGIIQVKLIQEVELATYTIRTFVIRNSKVKKVSFLLFFTFISLIIIKSRFSFKIYL